MIVDTTQSKIERKMESHVNEPICRWLTLAGNVALIDKGLFMTDTRHLTVKELLLLNGTAWHV